MFHREVTIPHDSTNTGSLLGSKNQCFLVELEGSVSFFLPDREGPTKIWQERIPSQWYSVAHRIAHKHDNYPALMESFVKFPLFP